MSTLLQSHQHHQCVRIQSRKAREAQLYKDEYLKVMHDTAVVERQCAQRSRWDREREIRVVEELSGSGSKAPIAASHSELDGESKVSLLSVMILQVYNEINNCRSILRDNKHNSIDNEENVAVVILNKKSTVRHGCQFVRLLYNLSRKCRYDNYL